VCGQWHSGKRFLLKQRNSSPSASGRGFLIFFKKNIFFPECNTRGRVFLKKIKLFPKCCTPGRGFSKKTADSTDGVNSSPSVVTALGEVFPECTIFGTRGRALSRERHPRRLFPECCTQGRLPRVFLRLPRVHLTLREAGVSSGEITSLTNFPLLTTTLGASRRRLAF
jgi:hypothetical protein